MHIGICGLGVTGSANRKWLKENTRHKIFEYDPPLEKLDSFRTCTVALICVPAPTVWVDGKYRIDEKILEESVNKCRSENKDIKIFIRSTVLPGTNDKYNTTSMPEFLTERFSDLEFTRQPILSIKKEENILKEMFPGKKLILLNNNQECELSKYMHNTFGSMKVTFCNLFKHYCELNGLEYQSVLMGAMSTGFMDKMYTQVPGHDSLYGFGGNCFVKDLNAFRDFINFNEYPHEIPDLLHAVANDNKFYRRKDI